MPRSVPKRLHRDNGPKFIASMIRRLAEPRSVESLHIAPGSLCDNRVVESFHARLQEELLDAEPFHNVEDAQALNRPSREEHDHRLPHSPLNGLLPAVYTASLDLPPVGATPLPPVRPAIGALFDSLMTRLS